jgi:hypothetical protein
MAQLKSTNILGNLAVTGNVVASSIKIPDKSGFLKADGTVDSTAYGTVTNITVGTGLTTGSGSAITTSGTISLDVAGTKTALGLGSAAYTESTSYATKDDIAKYLPLTGNTNTTLMTGPIKYGGKTQEIISVAPEYQGGSWKGGMKYSWDSKTTLALWGKNSECQFVWHAGADLSTGSTDGWTNRNYDFQVGRNSSSTLEALLGGKPLATQEWVSNGYLPLTAGYDNKLTGTLYATKPIGISGTFDSTVPTDV